MAGTAVCNARCPFCISKMTPPQGVTRLLPSEIHWRNFAKAARLAQMNGVTTVLITGKGEPTLYPDETTEFLSHLKPYDFPLIELQTNGLLFQKPGYGEHLRNWYDLGLNTIALSVVDWDSEKNREIYLPQAKEYPPLERTIGLLHEHRYSVRLSVTMVRGFVDTSCEVSRLVDLCRENKVEQLTVRPVRRPAVSEDPDAHAWVSERGLTSEEIATLHQDVEKHATRLLSLAHGAVVYDYRGQNLCLTDCLTLAPSGEEIRTLIFFPDGKIRYDWQYPGAVIL